MIKIFLGIMLFLAFSFTILAISYFIYKIIKINENGTKEYSWSFKIWGIQTSIKVTDKEKKGEENMYNLNFDKNRKKLKQNLNDEKCPEYKKMDFSSQEYEINFLKTIEEKKNGKDKIVY